MASAQDPLAAKYQNHRALVWQTAQYVLKTLDIAKAAHNGDAMQAVIFTTIWSSNVSLARAQGRFAGEMVPDEMRRPVTVARIAQLVGVPPETVRRHVVRLVEAGLCTRVGRKGVIVKGDALLRDEMLVAVERQLAAARQYHRNITPLLASETNAVRLQLGARD